MKTPEKLFDEAASMCGPYLTHAQAKSICIRVAATIYELGQGSKEFSNPLKVRNLVEVKNSLVSIHLDRLMVRINPLSQRAVLTSDRVTACVKLPEYGQKRFRLKILKNYNVSRANTDHN